MDRRGGQGAPTFLRPIMESLPGGVSVGVLVDGEALARAAATVVVDEARRAVAERGRFTVALSGGSTPRPVYRLLAEPPFAEAMPWQHTHVFWGDERCVDAGDPRSNERMAREALLGHVPIPAEQVHPMGCAAPGEAAARHAADEYEALLRRVLAPSGGADASSGRADSPPEAAAPSGGSASPEADTPTLDLVLLGLGENGHTASLFTGSPALDERKRWVTAAQEDPETAAVTSGTHRTDRLWRVTLTAPFINRARLVLFVASGAAKGVVAKHAIEGEGDPRELPALLIRPRPGRLWWLLDTAAGAWLPETSCAVPADVESYDDLPDCYGGPSR